MKTMSLMLGKKYICRVQNYDAQRDYGTCVTSWGQILGFSKKNVEVNMTHPENKEFEQNEFIVYIRHENLELVPPYYLGGCV